MDTLTLLQHYWWLIISLLGALLVFLLFVQGGQGLLYDIGKTEEERNMLVNSLGRKWEFTFTTLVTFGGAFFASFPLFYSTSFGGAFYVWMAILLVFVIQAVAYEYRRKPGNVFGEKTFNVFLMINGIAGPLLLGTAVGTLFTGANFTVDRLNLANQGGAAVISQWATPWHGLEAVAEWRNVLLGLSVTLLAMTLACQYFMNNIDDEAIFRRAARRMRTFAVLFVACFVAWLLALVLADGWAVDAAGTVFIEPYKYLHNLVEMPYVAAALLIGVLRKVFIMYGLSMTSPIDGSIIDTIVPLLVLLLSVLLGMDRFTELKVAGLLLGMAGAVAVVLTGASSSHQHSHVWGNVMIMLCACATALYMVWFKALVARYRITTVLRWVYCVAAVVALPFGLKEIIHTDYAAIAGHALFPTLFVLTVPTYLPNLMLNYALKSVPATVSSIYTYLQPVLAIAISVGMGLDKLHADTVVFALVIFVGVGLVLRSYSVPPRHPDPPAAPPH